MKELSRYIMAMTHLYGMVAKKKVVEIYNQLHDKPIRLADVQAIYQNPPAELAHAFVYTERDHFIHEVILESFEFDQMLHKKADKPYYIPEKEELLRYADGEYFEKTPQYKALITHLKKRYFQGDEQKAEEFTSELQLACEDGLDTEGIFNSLNEWDIPFDDLDQLNELLRYVMDFANHTRIWANNGHTPREIFLRFDQPLLKPLPEQPVDLNATNVIDIRTRKHIGRNDPCPCGSGKKFKHCCLLKADD